MWSLACSIALLSTTTGCSMMNKGEQSTESDQSDSSSGVSTTAIGAASGAAIGAGLGAIIGSTSGSAGEGVAIGAAAGAVTGAGIGYQLERQELALNDNRRSIETQDQLIARQDQELALLRQGAGDQNLPQLGENIGNARTSKAHGTSAARVNTREVKGLSSTTGRAESGHSANWKGISNTYRGNPNAKPFGSSNSLAPQSNNRRSSGMAEAQKISKKSMAADSKVKMAKLEKSSTERSMRSHEVKTSLQASNSISAPEVKTVDLQKSVSKSPIAEAKNLSAQEARGSLAVKSSDALPPARSVKNDDSSDDGENLAIEAQDSAAEVLPLATESAKTAAIEAKAPTITAPTIENNSVAKQAKPEIKRNEGDCKQASGEAQRGLNATADADRLFYLRRAARLCPAEPTYHVELGKVYSEIGKSVEARSEFKQAIEMDPSNQIARDELSIIENVGGKSE